MYHCIILLPLPPIFWKLPSIICKQSTSCLSIKHWLLVHYYHLNNNINLFLTALQLDRPVPRYKEDTETFSAFIDHVQLWSATTRNHRCTFLSWLWFLVVYPRTLHNTMHVQYAPYFYCLYIYQTTFTKQHSIQWQDGHSPSTTRQVKEGGHSNPFTNTWSTIFWQSTGNTFANALKQLFK